MDNNNTNTTNNHGNDNINDGDDNSHDGDADHDEGDKSSGEEEHDHDEEDDEEEDEGEEEEEDNDGDDRDEEEEDDDEEPLESPVKQRPTAMAAQAGRSTHRRRLAAFPSRAKLPQSKPVASKTSGANDPASERTDPIREADVLASPMLRILRGDSGSRQSLLSMLPIADLVSLLATSRSWRAWIEHGHSLGSQRVTVWNYTQPSFSACGWVQQSTQSLQICYQTPPGAKAVWSVVPSCTRLRTLHVKAYSCVVRGYRMRASFAAVSTRLQHLEFESINVDCAFALLLALGPLRVLESLVIRGSIDIPECDFAVVPSLPRLTRLILDEQGGRMKQCRPAQIEALARCTSLTDLDCGEWLPESHRHPTRRPPDEVENLDGIAMFLRLRADHGAARLRRWVLGSRPLVEPDGWRLVSQCTELEELDPCVRWSPALTADDWMQLRHFTQLRSISIFDGTRAGNADPASAVIDLSRVCSALVHCRSLRRVQLVGCGRRSDKFVNEPLQPLLAADVALLARLPLLEWFHGRSLLLESLAPLSDAPALTELELFTCRGLHGELINLRAMIPAMPLLQSLTIEDADGVFSVGETAAPFDAALYQRLPKLTPEQFSVYYEENDDD